MFKRLRIKSPSEVEKPEPTSISISQLIGDVSLPITINALNGLPENFNHSFWGQNSLKLLYIIFVKHEKGSY